MVYTVYILRSATSDRLYIGQTQDLDKRLEKHNSNQVKSTKGRGPWELYFSIEVSTRSESVSLERKLKNFKSRKRIDAWIEKQEK